MRRSGWITAALLGLLAAGSSLHDGAAAVGPSSPAGVHSASLSQKGTQLVWHVALDSGFSVAQLHSQGRSLCLLFPGGHGVGAGALCVAPGRHGMRLVFSPRSGAARGISASVAATGPELTVLFDPTTIGLRYRPVRWQVQSSIGATNCTPGSTCTVLFPATPALAKLRTPRLVGCTTGGAAFVTHGPLGRREIALTFDDGPWPDTPAFLKILEREHVNATFFQIGEQVGTYGPAVDKRMLADGDIIGDHSWSHPNLAGAGSFAAGQISETATAIRKLTGFRPCLLRAPYGSVSPALIGEARRMGFTTIQWDVDPRDWSRPGTGAIYSNVVRNAHDGAIVIQHDGGGDRSETLAALPREIETLRHEGYRFVTITQMLGLRLIYK